MRIDQYKLMTGMMECGKAHYRIAEQACCRMCPIGKDAHRLALDCRQYIEIFPETAVKLAQNWNEKNA